MEYITLQLLQGNQDGDETVSGFLNKYDFFIFPIVNPDGELYSQTPKRPTTDFKQVSSIAKQLIVSGVRTVSLPRRLLLINPATVSTSTVIGSSHGTRPLEATPRTLVLRHTADRKHPTHQRTRASISSFASCAMMLVSSSTSTGTATDNTSSRPSDTRRLYTPQSSANGQRLRRSSVRRSEIRRREASHTHTDRAVQRFIRRPVLHPITSTVLAAPSSLTPLSCQTLESTASFFPHR